MSPYLYAIDWPEQWQNSQLSVSIGQKRQLTDQNLYNEYAYMRADTNFKRPTLVALLLLSILWYAKNFPISEPRLEGNRNIRNCDGPNFHKNTTKYFTVRGCPPSVAQLARQFSSAMPVSTV